ncbi:MAG: hypothetical protein LBV74_12300 [Tannerella sp.]|jgi:hypothetical protein|nr:hypothetical protein [Tannerella sp.]
MTLKEAQKEWYDAISMKVSHKANSVTEEQLIKWAGQSWNIPIKPLFIKIGKTSSRIIYSKLAAKEEERQKSMTPGTKVRMTGAEASFEEYKDKVWTITHGPQLMCGDWVVWLESYSGAYCCEYLEIIEHA